MDTWNIVDDPPDRSERGLESDQAARLAALNARRRDALAAPVGSCATEPPLRPPTFAPASRPTTGARRGIGADARPRRRHAARGARATALGLSLASTGALATLFAFTGGQALGGNQVAAASIVTSPRPRLRPRRPPRTPPTSPRRLPARHQSGDHVARARTAAATTVVDGAVFSNKWGEVQVEATFAADGTLVDVTTLQTPYRDGKSVRINERAVPQLNSEALTAQSAPVDTVSGATYTSTDYRRSLQSAIDAANAAGITALA